MPPDYRGSRWLAAVALCACVSPPIRGEAQQARADARPLRALDVTARLARDGVTAGVVMCRDLPSTTDEEHSADRAEARPADLVEPAGAPAQATCDALNASLFERHEGGVLHLRTTGEPQRVTDLLNRPIHLEAEYGVPAIDAVLTRIVNAVRSNDSAVIRRSTGATGYLVTLRGGPTTVMEALDEVVRQAPGLVWFMHFSSRDGDGPLGIGLIGPHGGSGTSVFPLPNR
jgi:hypothetical protein